MPFLNDPMAPTFANSFAVIVLALGIPLRISLTLLNCEAVRKWFCTLSIVIFIALLGRGTVVVAPAQQDMRPVRVQRNQHKPDEKNPQDRKGGIKPWISSARK